VAASGSSVPSESPAGTDAPQPTSSSAVALPGTGEAQNVLLVGVDSRAGLSSAQRRYLHLGQHDQTTSTDTIMLLHVPADGSRATLISIPRDTYVNIPGYNSNKINAAYADGYYLSGAQGTDAQQAAGANELVATVKALTGAEIDHYVQVGFAGFIDIVKAIGTIPINLCESVNDTHKHNVQEGTNGGSGFVMSAGHHDLTPRQALEFVRQRHNIPGPITDDLGRELRQRYFLSEVFKKVMSAGMLFNQSKLRALITAVNNAFTFDDNFDILKLAGQLSHLTAGNIHSAVIPTTGNQVINGQDVLTADPAGVQRFVQDAFSGTASPAKHHKPHAHPTAPPVQQGCVY
jgi:LCP family protein required for cell wall assembly